MKTIWHSKKTVKLIDQRKLPLQEKIVTCRNYKQVITAIKTMQIRGAPAIGIAGAYALALAAAMTGGNIKRLRKIADEITATRPTAVNLAWAVERCFAVAKQRVSECRGIGVSGKARSTIDDGRTTLPSALLSEAKQIAREEEQSCLAMGRHGAKLIKRGWRLLTHCNAGSLASVGLGTALAPIKLAHRQGGKISVFVDETRPLLQGARLTAYELKKEGVPFHVISDNMAAHFMSRGEVDCVITGADRIAANGDAANKIGTLGLAVSCAHFGIPFYVVAPSSTFDLSLSSGRKIPIEERPKQEVEYCGGKRIVPRGAKVRNPAFDVTPAKLITAIVCEKGVIRPPYRKNIKGLLRTR